MATGRPYSRPLGAPATWDQIMEAADHSCQCDGACGTRHYSRRTRCGLKQDSYAHGAGRVRLIVAPPDLTISPAQSASLPATELRAWCQPCYQAARRRALDAAERARRAEGPQPQALFDLD